MEEVFIDQTAAEKLGDQEIMVVRIPKAHFERTKIGLKAELSLPNPESLAYTSVRKGRIHLEGNHSKSLNKVFNLKQGEQVLINNIRGMAGGLVYTTNGKFILKSKFYPKSGSRYFSPFSGVSSSFAEIQNPSLITFKEGIEELIMLNHKSKELYYLDSECFSIDETKKLARKAAQNLDVQGYTLKHLESISLEGPDRLNIIDSNGNLISSNPGVLGINPGGNSIDLLKVIEIKEIPKNTHLYDGEFGDNIVLIPFEQLQDMWKNWGKESKILSYTSTGEVKEVSYQNFFDTLTQTVAINLGIIQGLKRYNYKTYGQTSI